MRKVIAAFLVTLLIILPSCKNKAANEFIWEIGQTSNLVISDAIEMSILEEEKMTVQFQIHNSTEKTYYYGRAYILEVMQNGEWHSVDASPSLAYTLEQLSILPGESKSDSHSWPCELFEGKFRLIKQFYTDDVQGDSINIAAEFIVE